MMSLSSTFNSYNFRLHFIQICVSQTGMYPIKIHINYYSNGQAVYYHDSEYYHDNCSALVHTTTLTSVLSVTFGGQ